MFQSFRFRVTHRPLVRLWLPRLLIVAALLLALGVGFAVPALAAGSAQATNPNFSAVLVLLGAVFSFITGGGVAFILERIPLWKNWKPSSPEWKAWATIVLTGALAAGIVSLQNAQFLPNFFGTLPIATQIGIAFFCSYLASQLAHSVDEIVHTLKAGIPPALPPVSTLRR